MCHKPLAPTDPSMADTSKFRVADNNPEDMRHGSARMPVAARVCVEQDGR